VTQGVDVDLPTTATAKPASELTAETNSPPIIVQVDKKGMFGISANNESMILTSELAEVITRVKAERLLDPKVAVLIGGDQATPYLNVVSLLDALSSENVESVGLLTDIKE
jgi:biopolymer transport protein TolR